MSRLVGGRRQLEQRPRGVGGQQRATLWVDRTRVQGGGGGLIWCELTGWWDFQVTRGGAHTPRSVTVEGAAAVPQEGGREAVQRLGPGRGSS